jgi:chloramphenicol-sensitive protein RarD
MQNRKYYSAGIAAFVIWGFFSIPLRALADYSSGEILYFRILCSLLILMAILPFKRNEITHDWNKLLSLTPANRLSVVVLTLTGGLLLTVNWLTFIYIVNNINIKTASFAYLICPVITAVLGYLLIGEKLLKIQWIAVALCGLSCVIMGLNSGLELGFSFLTAFTYALYLISQRKNQGFDRIILLTIQVVFSFLILTFLYGLLVESVPVDGNFYLIILIIAGIFTVLPLFLNLFALNRINSATIGILMYINPIFNFSVAFLLFQERITWLQLTGYAIILIALVLFNYPNFRKLQVPLASKMS